MKSEISMSTSGYLSSEKFPHWLMTTRQSAKTNLGGNFSEPCLDMQKYCLGLGAFLVQKL